MSLTLIGFSAEWCGPCRMLKPIVEKVAARNSDVTFETVDIDEHPEVAQQMQVGAVPTLVFVKNGQVVDVMIGLYKEQAIEDTSNKWR